MKCRYEHGYAGTGSSGWCSSPRAGRIEQLGTWVAIGGHEVTMST